MYIRLSNNIITLKIKIIGKNINLTNLKANFNIALKTDFIKAVTLSHKKIKSLEIVYLYIVKPVKVQTISYHLMMPLFVTNTAHIKIQADNSINRISSIIKTAVCEENNILLITNKSYKRPMAIPEASEITATISWCGGKKIFICV